MAERDDAYRYDHKRKLAQKKSYEILTFSNYIFVIFSNTWSGYK